MAKVKVHIPTVFQELTQGAPEIEIEAEDVSRLIMGLENKFPGIKKRLCDRQGKLKGHINIFLNGQDTRFTKGVKFRDRDEVVIIPAIAGG